MPEGPCGSPPGTARRKGRVGRSSGAPRVHAVFRREGIACGRPRVAWLMRLAGLAGRHRRRRHRTTILDPLAAVRPDLILRDFQPIRAALDARWCGDITHVPSEEGWSVWPPFRHRLSPEGAAPGRCGASRHAVPSHGSPGAAASEAPLSGSTSIQRRLQPGAKGSLLARYSRSSVTFSDAEMKHVAIAGSLAYGHHRNLDR
ncbi:IS3 family transposase [Actinacidiphila sp. bgisy160]|uniref:IS3 family transposase n=1 Tax=Actinacidiphila sp. bgisy160 TaxID=3413796 RepID=UPI003D723A65